MKSKIKGLQLIINTVSTSLYPYLELASKALLGGIDSLQFRHKGIYDRETFFLACQLAELCHQFSVPLIVNDRADIALAIQAAGVHLGQADMSIMAARLLLGDEKIIGGTASTLTQAQQLESDGADYIGFGHIYPTKSKVKDTPPVGLNALKEVCREVNIPVLAIGGINEHHLADVFQAGVCGIAVISAISLSFDPCSQTQKYKKIMGSYGK